MSIFKPATVTIPDEWIRTCGDMFDVCRLLGPELMAVRNHLGLSRKELAERADVKEHDLVKAERDGELTADVAMRVVPVLAAEIECVTPSAIDADVEQLHAPAPDNIDPELPSAG